MRPVCRGASPRTGDFVDYADAKPELVSRLGTYCSYCERRVATNLAVEHIQPKGLAAYTHLAGRWSNFLLACVNCNAQKKDKNVVLAEVMLPDRDNTLAAYEYKLDGSVDPAQDLGPLARNAAVNTLALVGLDKPVSIFLDANGKQVALDRVAQRLQVWAIALEAKDDVDAHAGNEAVRRCTIKAAQGFGYFSIWMTVFANDLDMRRRLVDAFPGTRESGCFHAVAMTLICPSPNPDALEDGGKA